MPRGTVLGKRYLSKPWYRFRWVVAPPGKENVRGWGYPAQWGLSTSIRAVAAYSTGRPQTAGESAERPP
jgi:hypothetical protein